MQDPTTSPRDESLAHELHAIAEPARRALRAEHARQAHARALPVAIALLAVVPLLYLLACAVLRGFGTDFALPLGLVAALALLPPLVHYGVVRFRALREVRDAAALARIDDGLGLHDRLTAAHEFAAADVRTPFMDAVLRDARAHLAAARAYVPAPPRAQARLRPAYGAGPLVAVLALLASLWIGVRPVPGNAGTETANAAPEPVAQAPGEAQEASASRARALPSLERRAPEANAADEGSREQSEGGATQEQRKKSRGDQGRGKSSSAQSSSGQSTGEGQATDQAQPTKGVRKKPGAPREQKPPKEHPPREHRKQPQLEKDSVASSGQGKGRGSSRSPTASDWTSKDQSVADDEEELEDEDEVDDEDEESDARGGLQPNLRQRKPPVNRDLSIAFGGGPPPPHANGRGGPGLPKKQRGVAQLVLGIPYPDQITGQPNPGRTKVTQERIEPRPQDAETIAAAPRAARSSPLGRLARPVLLPWMQELIRNFHLTIRPEPQELSRGDAAR